MKSSREGGWVQVFYLVPALVLVALYAYVAGRLWAYVTTEFVKVNFGG